MNKTNLKMKDADESCNTGMWEVIKSSKYVYNSEAPSIKAENKHFGEYTLLFAILERAIFDYIGFSLPSAKDSTQQWLFYDARNWLQSNKVHDDSYFTFVYICEYLDLDPITTRQRIYNLKKESGASKISKSGRNKNISVNRILELC